MPRDIFDQHTIFQTLSPGQRDLLRPLLIPCDCHAGRRLFEQGNLANYLYLVVQGEITIYFKPEDGPEITVARVRSGGIVGWSAALGNRVYTSGAECSRYSQMLRVSGRELRDLCSRYPETGMLILEELATAIAERLRNTHGEVIALLKQGLRIEMRDPEEV